MPSGIYIRTEENKRKLSESHKGHIVTKETRDKMSKILTGKSCPNYSGAKNHNWKGNKVGYFALHAWIRKTKGKANICSFDPSHNANRFHWANISKSYSRDVNDWASLCPTCHKQYDMITGSNWPPSSYNLIYEGKGLVK